MSITAAAVLCLSAAVHYEARGEDLDGKVAVASVIMNRVESKRFPDTVCEVVKQRRQFSWYPKKPIIHGNQKNFSKRFLQGKYRRTVPNAYFFTSGTSKLKRPRLKKIGGHIFYGL